jgi:hypothetical protein
MRVVAFVAPALLTVLFVAACSETNRTPTEYAREFGGEVATYRAVAEMTDCEELANENARGQNNFEDTGDRAWDGYYHATAQRFDQLGCTVE